MKSLKKLLIIFIAVLLLSSCESDPYVDTDVVDITVNVSSSDSTGVSAENYYWTYTAVKADRLYNAGQTGSTETPLNVENGVWVKGLPSSLSGFSKGDWTFVINGYRAAQVSDDNLHYKGSSTSVNLSDTSKSVTVAVARTDSSVTMTLTDSVINICSNVTTMSSWTYGGTATFTDTATGSVLVEAQAVTVDETVLAAIQTGATGTYTLNVSAAYEGTTYTSAVTVYVVDYDSISIDITPITVDLYVTDNDTSYAGATKTSSITRNMISDLSGYVFGTVESADLTFGATTGGVTLADSVITATEAGTIEISCTDDGHTWTSIVPVTISSVEVHELSFKSSVDLSAANIFYYITLDTDWSIPVSLTDAWAPANSRVYIDDTLTEQTYDAISATAGEKITVLLLKSAAAYFPTMDLSGDHGISASEILQPLPSISWRPDRFSEVNNRTSTTLGTTVAQSLLYYTFDSCTLTEIPADLFKHNSEIGEFLGTFYGCTNLSSIPEDLFKYNTEVVTFNATFQNCTSLTEIPANLFNINPTVRNIKQVFQGTGITSIPANLFDGLVNCVNYARLFRNCTGLTSVPEGLFDDSPAVKYFDYTFAGCKGLTSVPENLYAKQTEAENLSLNASFYNCSNLTVNMIIGSANVNLTDTETNAAAYFAYGTAAKGTVSVPADSTTYDTFVAAASTSNVEVTTYSSSAESSEVSSVTALARGSISTYSMSDINGLEEYRK